MAMRIRVQLPEGLAGETQYKILTGNASVRNRYQLQMYFAANCRLSLVDALDFPFAESIEFSCLSKAEGILFQLRLAPDLSHQPVSVAIDSASGAEAGSFSQGLLAGSWNIRLNGPMPEGDFRISVQFS